MMNNYIKIFSIFITVAINNSVYCQAGNVGINTNNPQQKLHISGTSTLQDNNVGTTGVALISPTVRIDGLNSTVNPTVFTAVDTTNPLYINNLGISSVVKGETSSSYSAPGSDAITTSTTLNVSGIGYNSTGNLMSVSFTLVQRSMVFISSSISLDVRNTSNASITDGKARGLLAFLLFTAAPVASGIVLNSGYHSDGSTFFSNAAGINTLKLSPSTELILPAGTYTLVMRGAGISSGAAADDFKIIFGGGSGDKLNVLIKPL